MTLDIIIKGHYLYTCKIPCNIYISNKWKLLDYWNCVIISYLLTTIWFVYSFKNYKW